MKIPLMILSPLALKKITKRVYGLGNFISKFVPGLKYDIKCLEMDINSSEYSLACLINSLLIFLFMSSTIFLLSFYIAARPFSSSLLLALGIGLGIFLLFMFILLRFPLINSKKISEQIEKNLIFALKDLLLQAESGTNLYNSMIIVSKSNYGEISKEFEKIIKKLNSGAPMEAVLEKLAFETKSDYLKRTTWQLINTIKTGVSLRDTLISIIQELTEAQRSKISDYAKELNLWSLLYLLFAVAIPTIGIVFLLILGSFAGFDVTQATFISFLFINTFMQLALIGFIKSRRPVVQF